MKMKKADATSISFPARRLACHGNGSEYVIQVRFGKGTRSHMKHCFIFIDRTSFYLPAATSPRSITVGQMRLTQVTHTDHRSLVSWRHNCRSYLQRMQIKDL